MAKAAWKHMSPDRLAANIGAARAELADTRDIAERLGEETMNEIKVNIATRGTAKSGKVGRIDTGRMVDAVDYHVTGSDLKWGLKVGWIYHFFNYYKFQEYGFNHTNGDAIEPMFAMRDGWTNARDKARTEADALLQRVRRKIG